MSTEVTSTTQGVEETLQEGTTAVENKELSPIEIELAELKAQRVKDKEVLDKQRDAEKEAKKAANKLKEEQGKWQELYESEKSAREALESKVKQREIDSAIRAELSNSKAKAPDTVLKLLDKSAIEFNDDGSVDTKSVAKAFKALQKSDPILFEEGTTTVTPSVKRANEGDVVGGYEKELAEAKSQSDVENVMRKYGKVK